MNLSLVNFFRPYLAGTDAASQAAGISNGAYIVSMGPVILVGLILLHREGLSLSRAAALSADLEKRPNARIIPGAETTPSGTGDPGD
jgi:hypothetical protein